MNSNNIDRRVALSTLLILFGVHFLLQAFPQTGYDFGILVPVAAFVILLGIYGVATGFQRDARETVFWSAMLGFVGIIVLLQVLGVVRFSLTTFVGAAVISAGLSILLSTLFDSIESKTSRNGLIWGSWLSPRALLRFFRGWTSSQLRWSTSFGNRQSGACSLCSDWLFLSREVPGNEEF